MAEIRVVSQLSGGGFYERKPHFASELGRAVNGENELQRFPAFASVRLRLRVSAKNGENVPVVTLVPVAVDVWRAARRGFHENIVLIGLGKLPVLDLVHRSPADLCRPALPENRDRSLEILR